MGDVGDFFQDVWDNVSGRAARKQAERQQEALIRQQAAQRRVQQQTAAQKRKSERAISGAQRREPDIASIVGQARADTGGVGGTMLTGPQGVDPNDLLLGKKTLLGG